MDAAAGIITACSGHMACGGKVCEAVCWGHSACAGHATCKGHIALLRSGTRTPVHVCPLSPISKALLLVGLDPGPAPFCCSLTLASALCPRPTP